MEGLGFGPPQAKCWSLFHQWIWISTWVPGLSLFRVIWSNEDNQFYVSGLVQPVFSQPILMAPLPCVDSVFKMIGYNCGTCKQPPSISSWFCNLFGNSDACFGWYQIFFIVSYESVLLLVLITRIDYVVHVGCCLRILPPGDQWYHRHNQHIYWNEHADINDFCLHKQRADHQQLRKKQCSLIVAKKLGGHIYLNLLEHLSLYAR